MKLLSRLRLLRHGVPGRYLVSFREVARSLTLGTLILILVGCTAVASRDPGASRTEGPGSPPSTVSGSRSSEPSAPPKPQWGREPVSSSDSGFTPYSQDLMVLRHQVAARCAAARDYEEPDPLASLVADLYLSAIDPASAAEALILGDCGSLESVVRELVAQGGHQVVGPVTSRASLLGGAGAQRGIEAAVVAGLDRARGTPDPSTQVVSPGANTYALAHISPRSGSASLAGADALNALYGNATPGFGLYTFVLLSAGSGTQGAAQQARSKELLRVIETYVPKEGAGAPGPEVHAFLVAVHPERADLPLSEQTGPELSDPMRRQLALELRGAGLGPLARRLETRPGPFLVSGSEPRLLPGGAGSVRLVVDLSGIGSEYLYAVVDAFDRPVPPGPGAGLDAIRDRLLMLPVGGDGAVKDDWVFRTLASASPRVAR